MGRQVILLINSWTAMNSEKIDTLSLRIYILNFFRATCCRSLSGQIMQRWRLLSEFGEVLIVFLSHSLLVHRAPETVIMWEDLRALATPHEAVDNYWSVPSLQLQAVIIGSLMSSIPKMVDPKLPRALKLQSVIMSARPWVLVSHQDAFIIYRFDADQQFIFSWELL